jgi:hypothetical protein
MKKFLFSVIALFPFLTALAQANADSLAAETTLEELFTVCNSVSPEGEDTSVVIFERLAPYILFNGNDVTRKNKMACDYNKVDDRKLVDKTGLVIKNWLDVISEFKVVKYQNVKKDNLEWHILIVSSKPSNKVKDKAFGFIKIKDKFLLGNIE